MKVRLSFYYVGELQKATEAYTKFLGSPPIYSDKDWVRFHLEGGNLALHRNEELPVTTLHEPVCYGAIVSLTIEDMDEVLRLANECGFTQVGEIQNFSYGAQAQIRDAWGNRLSLVEPKED